MVFQTCQQKKSSQYQENPSQEEAVRQTLEQYLIFKIGSGSLDNSHPNIFYLQWGD